MNLIKQQDVSDISVREISNAQLYGSVFRLIKMVELDKNFNIADESNDSDINF